MNDPAPRLRPLGVLAGALVAIAACNGDPTLAVAVHHPTGYAVTQTSLTVYFGGDASCGKIEFGDFSDAELAAITVDEADATTGGRVELSRLGSKSLVARGYDAQQRFVTAGCKDVGEVTGTTEVTIDTQPTSVVAIDPSQPDRPFSERTILVTMSDVNGAPIDGSVSWQLTGPSGAPEQPPADGLPTRNGQAKIQVADLGVPGPEGLRIRAPWATAPLPLVTAFDLSRATTIALDVTGGAGGGATNATHPSCDVRGHAGKPPTLVCLLQPNLGGHRDVVELAWTTDHFEPTKHLVPASIDNQFAVFVDHDGSADEPVYVVSASASGAGNWYKLDAPGTGLAVAFDSALQNVVYVPSCQQAGSIALVGVTTGTAIGAGSALLEKEQLFSVTGVASANGANDGEMFSGGCVIDVDQHEHQGVVLTGPSGDPTLFLVQRNAKDNTFTTMSVPSSKLNGSGFVAVSAQGAVERRFAGTRLQATGTVVFEAVLAAEANGFKLVERTELDAAAPPTKILAGKLDRDPDTDLMWDMAAGARRRFFQVSLARQVGGAPLTAMTSGPISVAAVNATADFTVGDLDGNGFDEAIVFTSTGVTIYAP